MRNMNVECKRLLAELKDLEAYTLNWLKKNDEEHKELADKVRNELLSSMQKDIKTLEGMKPGTIVEVM